MYEIVNRSSDFLRGFDRILTYGHSMGGYAALRYSAALGAKSAMAFSPQFSLAPDATKIPSPWREFYRADCHAEMAIKATDLTSCSFLVYDPHDKIDSEHAKLVQTASAAVRLIEVPLVGHGAVRVLASSDAAMAALEAALAGDADELKNTLRRSRRLPHYRYSLDRLKVLTDVLARHSSAKRVEVLTSRIDRLRQSSLQESFRTECLEMLFKIAKLSGKKSDAIMLGQELSQMRPGNPHLLFDLARLLFDESRNPEAVHNAYEAHLLAPRSVHVARLLREILLSSGFLDEARRVGAIAEALS